MGIKQLQQPARCRFDSEEHADANTDSIRRLTYIMLVIHTSA